MQHTTLPFRYTTRRGRRITIWASGRSSLFGYGATQPAANSPIQNAIRLALVAKIHFFSSDVTRCLRFCKVLFLLRDSPSITVRWACK